MEERSMLAQQNRLRRRIAGFACRVRGALNELGFEQRQKLVQLMVEEVRVSGCQVVIRLRIPLDQSPDNAPSNPSSSPRTTDAQPKSTNDRLRSLDDHPRRFLPRPARTQQGRDRGGGRPSPTVPLP
jgi:hypothetical protein